MYPTVFLIHVISDSVILHASLAAMVQFSLPYNTARRASELYSFIFLIFFKVFCPKCLSRGSTQQSYHGIYPALGSQPIQGSSTYWQVSQEEAGWFGESFITFQKTAVQDCLKTKAIYPLKHQDPLTQQHSVTYQNT